MYYYSKDYLLWVLCILNFTTKFLHLLSDLVQLISNISLPLVPCEQIQRKWLLVKQIDGHCSGKTRSNVSFEVECPQTFGRTVEV